MSNKIDIKNPLCNNILLYYVNKWNLDLSNVQIIYVLDMHVNLCILNRQSLICIFKHNISENL